MLLIQSILFTFLLCPRNIFGLSYNKSFNANHELARKTIGLKFEGVLPELNGRNPNNMDSLVQVNFVFRHGDRNQAILQPGDPPSWQIPPVGVGELTAIGKRQGYQLGRTLRQRYAGFIGRYSVNEIYTTSSDINRAIETAQALLAGLFPPDLLDSENYWNIFIPWNPIPVHTLNPQLDNLIYFENFPCPRYAQLLGEVLTGPKVQAVNSANRDLYDYIAENVGRPINSIFDVLVLEDIFSVLSAHKIPLPVWAQSIFPNRTRFFADFYFLLLTDTQEMRDLRTGPLFTRIVTNMDVQRGQASYLPPATLSNWPRAKMYAFSGHDVTVAAILNGLDLGNGLRPPYTATAIFELHKDPQNNSFVKFFYRNESTSAPHEIYNSKCGSPCYLDNLKTAYSSLLNLKNDYDQRCSARSV